MPDKPIIFDFGGMSPADVNRVARELKEQSFGQLKDDPELGQMANSIGNEFLKFLSFVFRELGLLDRIGLMTNCPFAPVAADNRYGNSPTELMKQAWNNRAHNWGIVETPANYIVTMQTLLEFLKASGKEETFLSLGSGPGLYETYLAYLFQGAGITNIRIIAMDYAKEMTRRHEEVLDKLRTQEKSGQVRKLKNIEAVTGDMTKLKLASGSIDQIICNNSLQWVDDWKRAIAEMARVMKPDGLGWLYLFVHTHPMAVYEVDGKVAFSLGDFQIPDLLDVLEANRFSAHRLRQIAGSPGTGQAGTQTSRVFIQAQFQAKGEISSWRNSRISSRLSGLRV